MKIGILGAGAVGTLLAVAMKSSGQQVWIGDTGARLEHIKRHGLALQRLDGSLQRWEFPELLNDIAPGTELDVVILAVKAHRLAAVIPALQRCMAESTAIMPVQNGIPWWYFQRYGGAYAGTQLQSCDPDGSLGRAIDPQRIIGCVVYPSADTLSDGTVVHREGERLTIGELDGITSARAEKIAAAIRTAGFKSYITDNIRGELWLKAWGALSFNPISALTGATMAEIALNPHTNALVRRMMAESQAIAAKLGVEIRHGIDKRIEGAKAVGSHRTSMLQDVMHGCTMEVDALVQAVVELGDITGLPCDSIKAIAACAQLLNQRLRDT